MPLNVREGTLSSLLPLRKVPVLEVRGVCCGEVEMQIQARLGWTYGPTPPEPPSDPCGAADRLSLLGMLLRVWLWRMLCPGDHRGPGAGSKRLAPVLRTQINNPALEGRGS